MGCKKKLYQMRAPSENGEKTEAQITRKEQRPQPSDPISLERGVRQMLADKIIGDLVGLWLLVAEHLRLGTWDLLCGWTRQPSETVSPRLALQMVHEAAVCTTGIRANRTLQSRASFQLINGLPFVATDTAIHELLNERAVEDCLRLQVALGKLRLIAGHFQGKLLVMDPHRVPSHSKRRMRERVETQGYRATKKAQTFWVLDADSKQPVCFTTATNSRTVVSATPQLVDLVQQIFPQRGEMLVAADAEHFSAELLNDIAQRHGVDLLVPIPNQPAFRKQYLEISPEQFTRHWPGFALAKRPYQFHHQQPTGCWQYIERFGERPDEWRFKGFMSTKDSSAVELLARDYPQRWHLEEFFNANQALGWKRSGTQNVNIRYGQMTMALIAQAVIHQLRSTLGPPYETWDAQHLAKDLFFALEGDVRVTHDTIIVTYYNAPDSEHLRHRYENLPEKLKAENVSPKIPWLYNYMLDFKFR
jgi:Transposase DDE domain